MNWWLQRAWAWLFNDYPLVEPPWTLHLAQLYLEDHVPAEETFCVRQAIWRHSNAEPTVSYTVSIFKGQLLPVSVEGKDLRLTVEKAVSDYGQ